MSSGEKYVLLRFHSLFDTNCLYCLLSLPLSLSLVLDVVVGAVLALSLPNKSPGSRAVYFILSKGSGMEE